MRYRPGWKGRLHVAQDRKVRWDGAVVGRVWSRSKEGAMSPGGMVTNAVFLASRPGSEEAIEFASMDLAIASLIPDGAPAA